MAVQLASPDQLQPKPDVQDLIFGKYFTDHMLKAMYHESLGGWQRPQIIPFENLVLHPAAKVLHYAIEVNVFSLMLMLKVDMWTLHPVLFSFQNESVSSQFSGSCGLYYTHNCKHRLCI